jgi:hypothetical protein
MASMRLFAMPTLRAFALVLALSAALLMGCTRGGGDIPDAQKVVVDRVEFQIPGAMSEVAVQGVDSFVGQWKSSEMSLLLDLGGHSDPLGYDSKDGFRVTLTTIDGKAATIERFMDPGADAERPYVAAIHFADAGEGQKLTIFGRAATEDDQDVLMAIYKSVKFNEDDA